MPVAILNYLFTIWITNEPFSFSCTYISNNMKEMNFIMKRWEQIDDNLSALLRFLCICCNKTCRISYFENIKVKNFFSKRSTHTVSETYTLYSRLLFSIHKFSNTNQHSYHSTQHDPILIGKCWGACPTLMHRCTVFRS